jgi:hypothetical protein
MEGKPNAKPKRTPKRVLRLPDLDHSKRTVLDGLASPDSARAYAFAMNDFIAWYCSEPRLAFSKHVVLRYRIELESRHLSASTINLRLAAVRRLAFEADSGLLSPELAAGIHPISRLAASLFRRRRREVPVCRLRTKWSVATCCVRDD